MDVREDFGFLTKVLFLFLRALLLSACNKDVRLEIGQPSYHYEAKGSNADKKRRGACKQQHHLALMTSALFFFSFYKPLR